VQGDYQLVMLHTGSLRLTVDDETYSYEAGVVVLLHPGHKEFFQFSRDSRTHHSWICLRGPQMSHDMLETLGRIPRAIPLSQRMNYLTQEVVYWNRVHPRPVSLLYSIANYALHLFIKEASGTIVSPVREYEPIRLVKQYIQFHYHEYLCLEDLSKQAAISAEHLCRLFRAQCGVGPMTYLWQYRTKRALELLTATGLPVVDVAERCGFTTPNHLHRKVKEATGMSPTQYRKQDWHSMDASVGR
jgi:AraC family transcriptional regulator of arabinose operon